MVSGSVGAFSVRGLKDASQDVVIVGCHKAVDVIDLFQKGRIYHIVQFHPLGHSIDILLEFELSLGRHLVI